MRKFFYSIIFISSIANAQKTSEFNGLNMSPGNLFLLSNAKTRSISPENLTVNPAKAEWLHLKMAVHTMLQEN